MGIICGARKSFSGVSLRPRGRVEVIDLQEEILKYKLTIVKFPRGNM
jgi:hypothetical protein